MLSAAWAVYALSFWHYLLYWRAYRYGAVAPARFRRNAILMKTVALAALASVYLAEPWQWMPAIAIGGGFLLNLAGARALGHVRTFYGYELGELRPQRVTSLPYSVVPHPMLTGNIIAFGGTLLHPDFRRDWWPLAVLHVAFNIGLIVMETYVEPQHPRSFTGGRMSQLTAPSRFHATVGTFAGGPLQPTIDRLTRWVEETYRRQLTERPSLHVYVRKLPPDIIARIDELRGSSVILESIRRQFPSSSVITPLTHTDELYLSHYNKDRGGDQGLFDKHYDGNLGFLRFVSVVRALIYLQSDTSYTVVFGDSNVRRAFGTYEFGLLDFHRELHWVEGSYTPGAPQRILLKCNYLIAPPNAGWAVRLVMAANTGVFYVVKAAMEYSKSPRTLPQRAVGVVCNVARSLNNVHPFLPLAIAGAGSLAAVVAGVALLSRVF